MDAGLADDLLHENVLGVFFLNRLSFVVELIVEDIKGKSTALVENLVDQELVLLVRMRKMNDLLASVVDVCLVVVVIPDSLLLGDQFANVDG